MIGRIRAAWDDSLRAANTRRGANPMSREEWFELQDRIANLVTGESMSIHLTDYRRHIERCIESQFRLHEARTRSDEPLTRNDVEAIAVNAAGDLIGKAFLGSASPTAPDTNTRTVAGALQADDADGVVREWNPETYEHNATRRNGILFFDDGPLTRADAAALGTEIKEKLDELLASKYAHTRPDNGAADGHIVATGIDAVFSKTSPEADDSLPDEPLDKFIAAQNAQTAKCAAEYQEFLTLRRPLADRTERNDPESEALATALRDRIAHDEHTLAIVHLFGLAVRGDDATRDAAYAFIAADQHLRFKLTDHAKQGGKCTADDLGVRLTITDPVVESVDGFERDGGFLRDEMHDGLHDSSPSAGDAGAHSVGEGEVAGVETAAPVTDATDCGSDAGCSAQVVLAGHVIDVTLEQHAVFGTLKVTVHLPGEPVWRTIVHPSLGNGDGNQVLPTHDLPIDKGLGGQGESEGSTSVGTLEGAGGLLGHTSAHASATSPEERVPGSGVVHESEHGEGPAGCGHRGADGGEREETHRVRPQCQGNDDVPVTVGPDVELVGVGNENGLEFGWGGDGPFGHSASPSIDGGHRTVGEGEVAGVETAAPVTDATDVFAGPGLFRYDGSQAHTAAHTAANEAVTRQAMTRQIGDYLAELHRQGESWHQMARLILHVFELRQTT